MHIEKIEERLVGGELNLAHDFALPYLPLFTQK
jgi:hypothetical protein